MGNPFLPFQEFKKSLETRNIIEKFIGDRKSEVDYARVELMREYLLEYYKRVEAVNSFADGDQIWDCVPIELQPSFGEKEHFSISEIPIIRSRANNAGYERSLKPGFSKQADQFGNKMSCPQGTIPLRRIGLEQLTKYKDVKEFHRKTDLSGIGIQLDKEQKDRGSFIAEHKYSYAKQIVHNFGAEGIFNLWQPRIMNGNQKFSLSQIWIVGGRGGETQTVEVGWQVNPAKFETQRPVLFVYWTPDNYASGSYNMELPNTFRQINNNWALGRGLSPVSTENGTQIELKLTWHFDRERWWLFVDETAIGYYPRQLFGDGALSKISDAIAIGGEVSGDRSWPPMGSGNFGHAGYGKSAYIRNICRVSLDHVFDNMELNPIMTSPNCYDYVGGNTAGWDSNFYYGGPGGSGCE